MQLLRFRSHSNSAFSSYLLLWVVWNGLTNEAGSSVLMVAARRDAKPVEVRVVFDRVDLGCHTAPKSRKRLKFEIQTNNYATYLTPLPEKADSQLVP